MKLLISKNDCISMKTIVLKRPCNELSSFFFYEKKILIQYFVMNRRKLKCQKCLQSYNALRNFGY